MRVGFRFLKSSAFIFGLILCIPFDSAPAQKAPPASRIPRGSGKVEGPPVKPLDSGRRSAVLEAASRIDKLVESQYSRHGVTPNSTLPDSLFCRRAYLQIAGRIPKLEEVGAFVQSGDADRRAQLVDELLGSQDHVSHMFNYWGNTLRLKDHPTNNNQIAQPYHEWIKESIAKNTPYDKWVYEMLTAEGRIWENPAVGYVMRDSGMDLDYVDNTVQVFLGTQIGCAQCHDHPFDRWTQHEYYEMASFTYGTLTRAGVGDKKKFTQGNPLTRLRDEMKKKDPSFNTNGSYSRMINANLFEVWENPGRKLKLPHDYAYDNGKPNDLVKPKPIFGSIPEARPGESQRELMARWMTSPENPRFAKNIANRLWKHAFGIGLIEPVSDIKDDSLCSNPELLDFLTAELIRLSFDTRELQRIIYNTRTWQREATGTDIDFTEPYYFPGPVLRRMTAEQIWDSLLTLAVYDFESFTRPSTGKLADAVHLDLDKATPEDVRKAAEQYDATFSAAAQRKLTRQRNTYKGQITLARASELPLPLPPDHFLRQFGQGDRELIDAANTDGSVGQILTMFNGEITHMMLEKGSVIYDNVLRVGPVSDRINVIFYSILTRAPKSSEEDVARNEIRTAGAAGFGNVIWALINTKEFLFIQ
ncbi:MAG: DUF1549 domain-containing protein [Planctomycetaceae bacterium]|nr:DUF1549 domain-containing protein [Planctomycetaceae bacterium]